MVQSFAILGHAPRETKFSSNFFDVMRRDSIVSAVGSRFINNLVEIGCAHCLQSAVLLRPAPVKLPHFRFYAWGHLCRVFESPQESHSGFVPQFFSKYAILPGFPPHAPKGCR